MRLNHNKKSFIDQVLSFSHTHTHTQDLFLVYVSFARTNRPIAYKWINYNNKHLDINIKS